MMTDFSGHDNERQRWDAFIEETMKTFHLNRAEAVTTAVSMIIRECMLAAEIAEAAV